MATVVQVQRITTQEASYGTLKMQGRTLQSVEAGRKPKTGMRQPSSTTVAIRYAPDVPRKMGATRGLRSGITASNVHKKLPAKLDKELPAIPRESTVTIPLTISKSVASFSPYLQHKHTSSVDSRPDESSTLFPNAKDYCSQREPHTHKPSRTPEPPETVELLQPTVFSESRESPRTIKSPSIGSEVSSAKLSSLHDSPLHRSWTPLDDFVVTPVSAASSSPLRSQAAFKPIENGISVSISAESFSRAPTINTTDLPPTPRFDDLGSVKDYNSPLALATISQPLSPLSCPPPYFESEPTTAIEGHSSLPDMGSKPSKVSVPENTAPDSLTPRKLSIRKKENRQTPKDIIADWRSSTSSDQEHAFHDELPSATLDPAKEYQDLLAGLPPYSLTRPQSFISFKSSRPVVVIPTNPQSSIPQQVNLEKPLPIPKEPSSPIGAPNTHPAIYHSHSDSKASATAAILPSYTDPTPPTSPSHEGPLDPPRVVKFPFDQPADSAKSGNTILSAPPLEYSHYHCYTSHRHMVPSRNMLHPVACMTCDMQDAGVRWKCSWCCLRACKDCMPKLDAAGRGKVTQDGGSILQRMLDSLGKV